MKFVYENLRPTVFPGYYNSCLVEDFYYGYCGDEAPKGYYFDFKKGGFKKYAELTNEEWVYQMKQYLETDNPADVTILKYKGMWSPTYYNYTTDKISFDVEFNRKKLEKYCFEDNKRNFDEYLNRVWSSHSGFSSFVPNSLLKFVSQYKAKDDEDTLLNLMLEFYFLEQINFEEVFCRVMDEESERYDGLVGLFSCEDNSEWDYEYDGEIKVTEKMGA